MPRAKIKQDKTFPGFADWLCWGTAPRITSLLTTLSEFLLLLLCLKATRGEGLASSQVFYGHLRKCFMEHTSSPAYVNCLLDSPGSLGAFKSPSQLTLSPCIFFPGLFLPRLSLLSFVHPCAVPCPRLQHPVLVPLNAFGNSILEASHQPWTASKSGKTKASLCARQVRIHNHSF